MRAISSKPIRLGRRGVAALEFALIGPVFIMLLMGAFEIFYLYIAQSDLDEASAQAARKMQTSSTLRTTVNGDQVAFKTSVFCPYLNVIPCSRVKIDLTPVPDFLSAAQSPALQPNGQPTATGLDTGTSESLMVLRAYATTGLPTWPVNIVNLVSSQPFQNEVSNMRPIRTIVSSTKGVAAVEFAMIAPFIVMIGLATADVTFGQNAGRRVQMAAQDVGAIATSLAVKAEDVNALTGADATTATQAAFVLLQGSSDLVPPKFGIVMSSVVMTPNQNPCPQAGCTYSPHVAWSGEFGGVLSPTLLRQCDIPNQGPALGSAPDDAASSPSTLPADVFTAAPLLVVDITYVYNPKFLGAIGVSTATFFQKTFSSYLALRTGQKTMSSWVKYLDLTDPRVHFCPGYN